mgnify:CR=1 FL=1
MEWLQRVENWATNYLHTMAFIRTFLSLVTSVLSVFIFLQIFGYRGA